MNKKYAVTGMIAISAIVLSLSLLLPTKDFAPGESKLVEFDHSGTTLERMIKLKVDVTLSNPVKPYSMVVEILTEKTEVPSPLVAYWNLDEGSGTTAYDSSGQGNHGTIYGATWSTGKHGNALDFDGVDDYVEISNEPFFDLERGETISIAAWINTNDATKWQDIVVKGANGKSRNYMLHVNANRLWFRIIDASLGYPMGHQEFVGDATLNDGVWYHVALTHTFGDGTSTKMYINGSQVSGSWVRGDGTFAPLVDYPVRIGWTCETAPTAETFTGIIDEVSVFNRALTPDEIRILYLRNEHPAGGIIVKAIKLGTIQDTPKIVFEIKPEYRAEPEDYLNPLILVLDNDTMRKVLNVHTLRFTNTSDKSLTIDRVKIQAEVMRQTTWVW